MLMLLVDERYREFVRYEKFSFVHRMLDKTRNSGSVPRTRCLDRASSTWSIRIGFPRRSKPGNETRRLDTCASIRESLHGSSVFFRDTACSFSDVNKVFCLRPLKHGEFPSLQPFFFRRCSSSLSLSRVQFCLCRSRLGHPLRS